MSNNEPKQLSASAATTLRERLKEDAELHTKACLRLAAGLYDVLMGQTASGSPLVNAWGFPSFDEYVESELKIHMTTARSYVRVYDELVVRRDFKVGVLPNSITMLRHLSRIAKRVANDRELARWIVRSKELTCCEFEHEVDAEYGGKIKKKNLAFTLPWSKVARAVGVVKQAKEAYSVATNGDALIRILNDWKDNQPAKVAKTG